MTQPTVQQKATLWLVLVFALGLALGGVLGYAFAHRSYAAEPIPTAEQRRGQHRERMIREVGLTPEQQKSVIAILDDAQTQYRAIRTASEPQVEAVRQKSRDQIRQLLTPEQKPKFEAFLKHLDDERRRIGQ